MEGPLLIRRIEHFLRRTNMSRTRFSRLATGDPNFVRDLREGRLPREKMERRVEHFMNTYLESANAD